MFILIFKTIIPLLITKILKKIFFTVNSEDKHTVIQSEWDLFALLKLVLLLR